MPSHNHGFNLKTFMFLDPIIVHGMHSCTCDFKNSLFLDLSYLLFCVEGFESGNFLVGSCLWSRKRAGS